MVQPAEDDRAEPWRNQDVNWDRWPVQEYLTENYRHPHPADLSVIAHHARFLRRFRPGAFARTLEFGAGPNLYPLMLAAAVSRRVDALERSTANVAYLRAQLTRGPDASWDEFYSQCRRRLPSLPERLADALSIVEIVHAADDAVPAAAYDLSGMHFVAESATEEPLEFRRLCQVFIGSVRPGGWLVAAFMENMGRYRLGDGSSWPGHRVDAAAVAEVFAPLTVELEVTRIETDATLPEYGYTGMVLLTARREP